MFGITVQLPRVFTLLLSSAVALGFISLVVLIFVLFKLASIEEAQEELYDRTASDAPELPALHYPQVYVEQVADYAAPAPVAVTPRAAGVSEGELTAFDVPDRTAAMLMAIVADEIGAPLETLSFISIREVK